MADIVEGSFSKPELNASPCDFKLKLPSFSIRINLPSIPFPPALPTLAFHFALSCDLANPISVSGGVAYGGGKVASFDSDPDMQEDF